MPGRPVAPSLPFSPGKQVQFEAISLLAGYTAGVPGRPSFPGNPGWPGVPRSP